MAGTSELFLDSAEDHDALSWKRLWRYVFRLAAQDSKNRMSNYFSSVEILQTISCLSFRDCTYSKRLAILFESGRIELPKITEAEIQDRSKGDGLSKGKISLRR